MKMVYEDRQTGEQREIDAREVRMMADDGHEAFAVRPGADGRSVEVRGIDTFFLKKVAYGSTLQAIPRATNVLVIEAREYDRN